MSLEEVAPGETIISTKRSRTVACPTPPDAPDRGTAAAAARALRDLRERIGWATTEDILRMRDEERR